MTPAGQTLPPFQAFLEEHATPVLAFLRAMVGPDDAEDCAQDTFLAALRAYRRAEPTNLRAWVLAIARNKALDHHRARARRAVPMAEPPEQAAPGPDGIGMAARDSAIWTAVADLPEKQRAAVILRFAVDLRYREVASAMRCSEEAARRNVHEGLKKLRVSAADLREEAA